jgi:hypothetical protein
MFAAKCALLVRAFFDFVAPLRGFIWLPIGVDESELQSDVQADRRFPILDIVTAPYVGMSSVDTTSMYDIGKHFDGSSYGKYNSSNIAILCKYRRTLIIACKPIHGRCIPDVALKHPHSHTIRIAVKKSHTADCINYPLLRYETCALLLPSGREGFPQV